jgi:hypothetical protein
MTTNLRRRLAIARMVACRACDPFAPRKCDSCRDAARDLG